MDVKVDFVFTEDDFRDLKNTVHIVGSVAKTHKGLGHQTAFLKTCDDAAMGVIGVGDKGTGKTKSIESIENLDRQLGRNVFTQEFTMAGIKEEFNQIFTGSRVTWLAKDLAKLSVTVVENMLKVACSILTDHACQVSTSMYDCDISNSTISWIGACTFEIYNLIMESTLWRGNYEDRIMPYFVFAYKRGEICPAIPIVKKYQNFDDKEIAVEHDNWFQRVADMLENHFTYARSVEYTERLFSGSARLNHREASTPADAKFILLHEFNIVAESFVGFRDTLTSPVDINTDPLYLFSEALTRGGISIPAIADKRRCSEESVHTVIDNYNWLFDVEKDIVRAHPDYISEIFEPQWQFERECYKRVVRKEMFE